MIYTSWSRDVYTSFWFDGDNWCKDVRPANFGVNKAELYSTIMRCSLWIKGVRQSLQLRNNKTCQKTRANDGNRAVVFQFHCLWCQQLLNLPYIRYFVTIYLPLCFKLAPWVATANYHIRCQNREEEGRLLRNNNLPVHAEFTRSLTGMSLLGQ
jgi:hypothetical protein